jgi:SAM-dependent methyltransferase
VRVSRELFYERQYRGTEYAASDRRHEEAGALSDFIASYDLGNKRVLEVGCGRGAFAHVARRWFGLDLAPSAGISVHRPFVSAAAEALPFGPESFSGVWSITVLEHVAEPEKALQEIARVLARGGVAYLAPAWHCRAWAADGYTVRPWADFSWKGKLVKASIPLRDALWFRAACTLPVRLWRECVFFMRKRRPVRLRYRSLRPNYETYWCTDADASSALDPHEMLLWFISRGWQTPSHPTWRRRFLVRHGAIIVRKPDPTSSGE